MLHTVLVTERFGCECATVLLDNFPGTAGQLELLAEVAAELGADMALLEVCARVETVVARVAQRRVCLNCAPGNHALAIPAPGDIEHCSACGASLSRRDTDVPRRHGLRLARYAANLPEITEAAAAQSIAHLRLDANGDLVQVCAAARHALRQLITAAASPLPLGAQQ